MVSNTERARLSATLIFGFAWVGAPETRMGGIGLLAVSVIAWVGFIQVEKKVEAPILDPQVLFNRAFITAASSGFMSFFGLLGVMIYSPVFAQNVMGVSPTVSGSMLTPSACCLLSWAFRRALSWPKPRNTSGCISPVTPS